MKRKTPFYLCECAKNRNKNCKKKNVTTNINKYCLVGYKVNFCVYTAYFRAQIWLRIIPCSLYFDIQVRNSSNSNTVYSKYPCLTPINVEFNPSQTFSMSVIQTELMPPLPIQGNPTNSPISVLTQSTFRFYHFLQKTTTATKMKWYKK